MVLDSPITKIPSSISRPHPHSNLSTNQPEEIWSRILQDVSSKNNNVAQGSVIFLGNDHSGKSSLIFRMTNGERQNYSSVLEYNYLIVHADPDGSYAYQLGSGTGLGPADTVNLPLWTLDSKEELAPLLRFAFPPQLAKCTVVLCVSLEQPGNILPTLHKWFRVVDEQIRAFYSSDEIDQARQMQIRFWQEYVEPIESSMHMESVSRLEIDPVLLPPEPGVLEANCGAAIIVAITKSDTHVDIGADVNKVQYHVRQFCLQHGAALIYTSSKEEKNTQLLYKYLAHRVFSLPFTHPAYIVENDSIFIPSGWDSEQKLSIIRETISDLEVPLLQEDYQQQSMAPSSHGGLSARGALGSDQVAETEDEQAFLQHLHVALQDGSVSGSGAVGLPSGGLTPKRQDGGGTAALNSATNASKNLAAQAASGGDSTTLASFFNSLLKKDTGNSPMSSNKSSASNLPSHVDPEAHLQKMLGKPQASSSPIATLKNGAETKLTESTNIAAMRIQDTISTTVTEAASQQQPTAVEEETAESSDISAAGSARSIEEGREKE